MQVGGSAALYTVPLMVAAVFAIGTALWAMYHRSRGGFLFAWMLAALSWWLFSYALELNSDRLNDAVLWGKAQYIAIVAIPPLWFSFALRYGGDERPFGWRGALLALLPALTLLLVLTNEHHGVVWAEVSLRAVDGVNMLAIRHGPWFWLHTMYAYGLIVSGSGVLIHAAWRAGPLYRHQAFILTAAALTPLAGNLIYLYGLGPLRYLDLTPFLFTITGGLYAWGIYRSRLLAIVPVARNLVIDEMGEGVLVVDSHGLIADLNPAARRMLGCTDSDLLRRPLALVVCDEQLQGALRDLGQAETRSREVSLDRGRHEQTLDIRITPLVDRRNRPQGHLVVMRDISDRKQDERELRRMYERQLQLAEQAEAGNRAKSTFIATISHELRTPLTAMLGFSDLVAEELRQRQEVELLADVEEVKTAGLHLLDLVNNLLALANIESGRLRLHIGLVDVAALVASAMRRAEPLAAHNHNQLTLRADDDLGMIETDAANLLQALHHLLANACKFTERGVIELRVYRRPADDAAAGGQPVEQVIFQISDTGIGMDRTQIDALFGKFTQADSSSTRRYGGLGLGLTLTRHICDYLGGTISVESAVGQGSVFTVRLPASHGTYDTAAVLTVSAARAANDSVATPMFFVGR